MIKLALIALLLFQSQEVPQTSFGFGAALAHAHPAASRFNVTGVFCGQKLVTDPANTTGHFFYGNAICADSGAGPRWYWFDWPADPDAGVKVSRWRSGRSVITLQVADPDCLLALSAVEGSPTIFTQVSGSGVYKGTATLTATLNSGGSPLVGKTISFTLNGAPAGTAVTIAGGVATVTNVSISGINAGTYATAVGATFASEGANIGSSGTGALTVSKADQSITFASPGGKTFGDPDFALNATASSELGVSFSATGNCTVAGATVHITGAGSCTVTASQSSGDLNYNPATNVQRSFPIAKANQTISFAALAGKTFGDAPFSVSATSSSGLPVGFSVVSGPASVNGSTLTLTGGGTVTVRASQAGDANYNAAPPVERSFNVARAGQTITFDPIANSTFGAADFQLGATTSSGLTVSYSAAGNCNVSGTTVHISGAGSCTVTASQAGDSNFGPAPDVARSFQIAKAATATAVVSSAGPAAHGQPVTFTATVTSAAGKPTGSVQFKVDESNFGSPQTVNADGVASISTAGLSAGAHVVTAEYGGDANFNPSAGTLSGGQVVGGIFEFAQALFTVNERGGSVAITVRRRGDASQAAAIEFATDDGSVPSVPVPCSSATGMALERCDYARAQGLLQFAPGETEKAFSVLVNNDAYLEGPETTRVKLSNPTAGTVLGEAPSATIEIADDAQQTSNPLGGSEFFVRQHYHDFLAREPDASGFQFWVSEIESCGADAGCREVKRINVSAAFFLSIEFQQTGYLVYRTYKAAYGDATSPNVAGTVPVVRLQEFLPDTRRIGEGVVVGATDWEQRLDGNKNRYISEFVQRPRFLTAYPLTMTAAEFVDKLNQNAGGVLSPSERDQLVAQLSVNPGDPARRTAALRAVAENAALQQNEFNRAFVLMEFYGYLRRNPDDAPDADFRGWRFWLDKLNEFNGNYVSAEMVKAFISSDEYRKRFGQ
ncbi:MAG: Ig-like domain repeat protein [Pyrinomonadaceae bacterium]